MSPTRDQELRQEDQEARELARTVFDTPIILEAGAGTGKTTTLIARILTWCLADGWKRNRAALDDDADAEDIAGRVLDRVAAITFTEKAAAEMSARFAEALGLILRDKPVNGFPEREVVDDRDERVKRARALLTNVHRLQIVTIHAFSGRLLRSHPIEAGLHPSFAVDAEGMALRGMIEKVLAEHLPGAYGLPGNPDLLALAELGIGPERLATMLEVLAREPRSSDLFGEDPLHPDRVRKTLSRLGTAMAPLLEALEVAFDAPPKSTTAKAVILKETLRELGDALLTVESAADLVGAVTQFVESGDGLERLKKWAGPGPTKTEQKLLGDAEGDVIAAAKAIAPQIAHLSKVNPAVLEHARAALEPLQVEVRRRMHHAGIETFSGLLADSKRLLEEHPQVAATERRNLDQLLVDEFQDTDPTQYALVGMLALEGDEAERPGLFLVGDPKQSIYGWRQADLGEYDQFVEKVVARGGKQLSLCVNFRSVPAILDEVERCISPIMHREIGIQPAFQRLLASEKNIDEKGFLAGKRSPVEYWNSWIRTDSGTAKRLECGLDTDLTVHDR